MQYKLLKEDIVRELANEDFSSGSSFASVLPPDFKEKHRSWTDSPRFVREPSEEQMEKAWENKQKMNAMGCSPDRLDKAEWFKKWMERPETMSASTGCPFLTSPEYNRQTQKFEELKKKDEDGLFGVVGGLDVEWRNSPRCASNGPNIVLIYDDVGGTRGCVGDVGTYSYYREGDAEKVVAAIASYFGDRLWWVDIDGDKISFGVEGPDFTPEVNSYYSRHQRNW